jgi:hypothetical protein
MTVSIIGITLGLTVFAASFKWPIFFELLLYGFILGCCAASIASLVKGDPAHIYIAYMAGAVATGIIIDKESKKRQGRK